LLQQVGLYDRMILDGGDLAILTAAFLHRENPSHDLIVKDLVRRQRLSRPKLRSYLEWAHRFGDRVKSRVGFAPVTIETMFHGSLKNRQYVERHRLLPGFDPAKDIALNPDGCWEWATEKPDAHRRVSEYFRARKEDEPRLAGAAPSAGETGAPPVAGPDGYSAEQRDLIRRCLRPRMNLIAIDCGPQTFPLAQHVKHLLCIEHDPVRAAELRALAGSNVTESFPDIGLDFDELAIYARRIGSSDSHHGSDLPGRHRPVRPGKDSIDTVGGTAGPAREPRAAGKARSLGILLVDRGASRTDWLRS
jgi:hypothetical protein